MKILFVPLSIILMCGVGLAETATDVLLRAAAAGKSELVGKALAEADANAKDRQGTPAVTLAAKSGDFETVKELLWAGADPRVKDASGNPALAYVPSNSEDQAGLILILRCYAFVAEFDTQNPKAKRPHLAIVSDNYVDYEHAKLRDAYWLNQAELKGRAGVDDDGNGFIDDVHGWNVMVNRPNRKPEILQSGSASERAFTKALLEKMDDLTPGHTDRSTMLRSHWTLENSYENPFAKRFGFNTLLAAGVAMNDLKYGELMQQASHGTHVAGIILAASEGKAQLHSANTWAVSAAAQASEMFRSNDRITRLAKSSASYKEALAKMVEGYRDASVANGLRASKYLQHTGAGVVNMSWGKTTEIMNINTVTALYEAFRIEKKANLKPLADMTPSEVTNRFLGDSIELRIANGAAFAVLFHQNPDVLFTVAAGNDASDNDSALPVPAYLARFFPNVLSIASHGPNFDRSNFTNIGKRSVQMAALGENVMSTMLEGFSGSMQGTSMAAPQVAGVAAGLRKDYPSLSAIEISEILRRSLKPLQAFQSISQWGGALDPAKARAVAKQYVGGGEFFDFTKLPKLDGALVDRATGGVAKPLLAVTNATGHDLAMTTGGTMRTKVLAKQGGGLGKQMLAASKNFPMEWVKERWNAGERVQDIGWGPDGWSVIAGKGSYKQFLCPFDQKELFQLMKRGFFIHAGAGGEGRYWFAMSEIKGIESQRFTLPTPLTESRQQWISSRWEEGYVITAIAGDDDPTVSDDGWLFVMSKVSNPAAQVYSMPGAWPTEWIATQQGKGYSITSIAGTEGRYIVVMSKGPFTKHSASTGSDFPKSWVEGLQ